MIAATEHWFTRAVIGLNLCPFAKNVHVKGQIRYVVSKAANVGDLIVELTDELRLLESSDPQQTNTTLFITPHAFEDFSDYNDALFKRGWSLTAARKTCMVGGMLMSSVITLSAFVSNIYLMLAFFGIAYASLAFAAASICGRCRATSRRYRITLRRSAASRISR